MSRTVLIVDDEPDLLELLRIMLEGEGYRVAVAGDGRAALGRLAAAPCDLVLSDMLMPRLDGEGLAATMRVEPALRDIPVILMSAAHRAPGAAVPHATFLGKPFDMGVLLATVARLLGPEPAEE